MSYTEDGRKPQCRNKQQSHRAATRLQAKDLRKGLKGGMPCRSVQVLVGYKRGKMCRQFAPKAELLFDGCNKVWQHISPQRAVVNNSGRIALSVYEHQLSVWWYRPLQHVARRNPLMFASAIPGFLRTAMGQ